MTKIKLCGLRRECDIEYANKLLPEYIGFIFALKSKRYVEPELALELRKKLNREILPIGVFVNEKPEVIADVVKRGIIVAVQLHGSEDNAYIARLRRLVGSSVEIIKAFVVKSENDVEAANNSDADYVLLDSGGGSGEVFDHSLIKNIDRPYFLAGGLTPENVGGVVSKLQPYAVDASSCLETDGFKDFTKMSAFVKAVRKD
ncbi:MAG: phosphoribosylanthranilate isomerase [Ruminococcus flavefaciens]|nr:phosphoribosylanthranilate isomerase [Ruminococcus flavefaciens]MCM1059711.1 phosphoribosylanthranilate isomerase [Eubacterium sp.]